MAILQSVGRVAQSLGWDVPVLGLNNKGLLRSGRAGSGRAGSGANVDVRLPGLVGMGKR